MLKFLAAVALAGAGALAGSGAGAAHAAPGDRIDGTPVIESLDAASLPRGTVHRFWFRAGDNALGQGWYVPVIVVAGVRPGPRLLLTAGIHGDELNGIAVIHRLAATLDPQALGGTVVMVPGLNTPGLLQDAREFTPGDDRAAPNLNRLMPGRVDGGAADWYAHRLWTGLLRPGTDAAVDLHTQSRGTAYVLFAFASTPRARRMAELVGPDIIKLDPGEKGTVENTMVPAGVPAITLELGRPGIFDPVIVARAVTGLVNLMTEMTMLPGAVRAFAPAFTGNAIAAVHAPVGGWATLVAPLGGDIDAGATIATIADPFGRIVATVTAPVAGRINTVFTDPRRDRGGLIARIVYRSADPKCAAGC